jgi:hypothetical protein
MIRTGLSREEVIFLETQMEAQESCPICHQVLPLQLDHCHETMVFRGFLCNNCNTGLGMFKDNPERVQAALDYLLRHQNKEVTDS